MYRFIILIFIGSNFLVACSKDFSSNTRAQIKFINASINAPKLELFADGALLATDIAYTNASNYVFVSPGNASLRIAAKDGQFPGLTIANGTFTVEEFEIYTLLITDSLNKLKSSFLKDDVSSPADGTSRIRFFHLAQNSPTVDIYLNNIKVDSNRVFNDQTNNLNTQKFNSYTAGTFPLEIRNKSNNAVIVRSDITLQSKTIYTILFKGDASASSNTPQALGINLINYN